MLSTVTATAFELVDQNGSRRAILATDQNGSPGLQLYRADGTIGVQIFVGAQGEAALSLFNERGREAVSVSAYPEGGGLVKLQDAADIPRAVVNVKADGTASVELHESLSRAPAWIRLHSDGTYDGSFERQGVVLVSRPNLAVVRGDKEDDES